MAATTELGLRIPEQNTYPRWNGWVSTVDPYRPFEPFTDYYRWKGKISSKDFQEKLEKIGALLGSSPKSDKVTDQWVAICNTPLKKRTISEETIKDVRRLLVTDDAARLFSRIKTEFVVLWALLNRGEFRKGVTEPESDKIALLKERFCKKHLNEIAWSFFNEGFYYVALQFYLALQEEQDASFVKSQVGRCFHLLGCSGKALEHFEEVKIQPEDLETFSEHEGYFEHLINMGDAYFDLHASEKAIKKYKEALKGLRAYRETFRNVKGAEDQKKEIQAFIALSALLRIRALDDESKQEKCFRKFLDAFWGDAEELHKWADRFPTTELRYRFFTAYKECGSSLDRLMGGSFMEYDSRETKKLFPFKEAHPAAIRPLFRFFPNFYPEQSIRLLILVSHFFASHSVIAKIHKRKGLQEENPIAQQKRYKVALKTAKEHLQSQKRENVIDQINAISKLGNMYAFLGEKNSSLEKTMKAWSCYKNALDLALKNDFQIRGAKEELSELEAQLEELSSRDVDPSYRLARKWAKEERYPEAALYFMKALKNFTYQGDDDPIYFDCKKWLKASLNQLSPPHDKKTLETLKRLEKLLEDFHDDNLRRYFEKFFKDEG